MNKKIFYLRRFSKYTCLSKNHLIIAHYSYKLAWICHCFRWVWRNFLRHLVFLLLLVKVVFVWEIHFGIAYPDQSLVPWWWKENIFYIHMYIYSYNIHYILTILLFQIFFWSWCFVLTQYSFTAMRVRWFKIGPISGFIWDM